VAFFDAIRLHGQTGIIKWQYQTAAQLGAWEVLHQAPQSGMPGRRAAVVDTRWRLSATIVKADAFCLARSPLVFVTDNGWAWLVQPETLQQSGSRLRAVLQRFVRS
jgi:hypothetical protein